MAQFDVTLCTEQQKRRIAFLVQKYKQQGMFESEAQRRAWTEVVNSVNFGSMPATRVKQGKGKFMKQSKKTARTVVVQQQQPVSAALYAMHTGFQDNEHPDPHP